MRMYFTKRANEERVDADRALRKLEFVADKIRAIINLFVSSPEPPTSRKVLHYMADVHNAYRDLDYLGGPLRHSLRILDKFHEQYIQAGEIDAKTQASGLVTISQIDSMTNPDMHFAESSVDAITMANKERFPLQYYIHRYEKHREAGNLDEFLAEEAGEFKEFVKYRLRLTLLNLEHIRGFLQDLPNRGVRIEEDPLDFEGLEL